MNIIGVNVIKIILKTKISFPFVTGEEIVVVDLRWLVTENPVAVTKWALAGAPSFGLTGNQSLRSICSSATYGFSEGNQEHDRFAFGMW